VSWAPNAIDAGEADSVIDDVALVMVKLAPVAIAPVLLTSPEYPAVTAYVPGTRVVAVWQLTAGSVAVQSTPLE